MVRGVSTLLRDVSVAPMGSMEAAEGGLREAIKLASTINADQATMQVECAKRELAFLITTRLPARVAEAEPLLRNVLEMLQARKAPMTLWLEIATDLGDVLGKQGPEAMTVWCRSIFTWNHVVVA